MIEVWILTVSMWVAQSGVTNQYASDARVLNESKWLGENRLGKVLMQVRQVLRESNER